MRSLSPALLSDANWLTACPSMVITGASSGLTAVAAPGDHAEAGQGADGIGDPLHVVRRRRIEGADRPDDEVPVRHPRPIAAAGLPRRTAARAAPASQRESGGPRRRPEGTGA